MRTRLSSTDFVGTVAMLLVLAGLLGVSQPTSAADGEFVNLSTRGLVGEGDDVRIVGFIIEGGARQVLIQAMGPELANRGISNALADPVLTVIQTHEGEPPRTPLDSPIERMVNDNWEDSQGQLVSDLWGGSPPLTAGSLSSAVVLTLEPGGYTARVEGKNGTVGVAIVEVYRIASAGGGQETTHGVGSTLSDLPTGSWTPDVTSGGSFLLSGGTATVRLNDGGFIEEGNFRYTCQNSGGCVIENRGVTSGTIVQTAQGTAPGGGTGTDTQPSFAAGSGPGNQSFTVDTAISVLTLPEASGGNGPLTYSLSPAVPGLTFNATTRRLTGTPTTAGTHSMTYIVTDADGDSDSLTFTISINSRDSESSDRAALTALYNATDGANWTNNANWLSDEPLEEWHRVYTNASGRVESLWLSSNELSGSIPAELGNLANLTQLSLGRNRLTGPVPPELGNLANLTRLILGENQLTGTIPPELGNLANLTQLSLGRNRLTGPVPPELGNLANLTRLILGENQLTGTIPPELGNLPNLESLYLVRNQLTQPIPETLLNLGRLTDLQIDDNDGLCVPGTRNFVDWVEGLDFFRGAHCNHLDVTVLRSLYETANGHGWSNSDAWNTGAALSEWHGVTADTLGHVVALDLSRNGLSGRLPGTLGLLTRLTELRIAGNALSGRLPLSLADLTLRELDYSETGLCNPPEEFFHQWLNDIEAHTATGVQCPPLSERDILVEIYDALGGPEWANNDNWLTDAPLGQWHGVEVDGQGRVVGLKFYQNRLRGAIPPVIGSLSGLESLQLEGNNGLTGPIPAELGNLRNLESLNIKWNHLRHPIPPELGNLVRLRHLNLELARLRGTIPPEIGRLTSLEYLNLSGNNFDQGGGLEGAIPKSIGNLAELSYLDLSWNDLTGDIPDVLGELGHLTNLDLSENDLTGPIPNRLGNPDTLRRLDLSENSLTGEIPDQIGRYARLRYLNLSDNHFNGTIPEALGNLSELEYLGLDRAGIVGAIPAELGALRSLRELRLKDNAEMAGPLPVELTGLHGLEALLAGGTALCAPEEAGFLAWLQRIPQRRIAFCMREAAAAYLVQTVQSRDFPVPLVAGEEALLRVFVTARTESNAGIPPVRATFFVNGTETYAVTIPPKLGPIPTSLSEGSLSQSANVEIPGWVVTPGLEMAIEVDPESTLDPGLGVKRRIPESGRLAVDVQAVPVLDLTLVPFIVKADPDSSIVELTREMAADPENHEVLWGIRELMPVGDLEVTAHAPVETSTDDSHELLGQTELIRVAEGATGYYMGMLPDFVGGTAYLGGRVSFANPSPGLMAHEIGHNFNLLHAPCPPGINSRDPSFPHPGGRIGVWGYDSRDGGRLVDPKTSDVMGYCGYEWPSDYHFTNALTYRLFDEGGGQGAAIAVAPDKSLLVWGGITAEGELFLEPAFVMDVPPSLPDSSGGHELTGRSVAGAELFTLPFSMPRMADGDGVSSSFVFALPIRPGWEDSLASITLTGPGGSATLDGNSNLPVSILRNPRTGQVRGILRDSPLAARMPADGTARVPADGSERSTADFEVLFSRGIPDAAAWR